MRSCDTEIINFQNYMFGRSRTFTFKPSNISDIEKSKHALKIIRWVIEDMLGWTPQEAKEHFSEREVEKFKLKRLIEFSVIRDIDVSSTDYPYLIHQAYPKEIEYDATEGIIKQWDEIMNSPEKKRFKSKLFDDDNGKEKAYTLLDEFNRRYISAESIEDLYKIYSNSGYINKKLNEKLLYTMCADIATYPITLLHWMLKNRYPGKENDYLYHIYLYNNVLKSIKAVHTKPE